MHGATDITGFGLIGHATEMARASGVTIAIDGTRLPLLPGVTRSRREPVGGMGTNREHFESASDAGTAAVGILDVCYDPQTSGGLLVSVDAAQSKRSSMSSPRRGVPAAVVGDVSVAGVLGRHPVVCPHVGATQSRSSVPRVRSS